MSEKITTPKRKAHQRTIPITRPCKKCRCKFSDNQACAKSPDLNGAENLFNLIDKELKAEARRIGWPKSKEELARRIEKILNAVPKSWFKSTMGSMPKRWKECIKRNSKMTDFFIPKYQK